MLLTTSYFPREVCGYPSWRHQMETFSALLALCAGNSPVSGEFPAQRPVTRSFDVFFDLRPIKRLCKHSRGWWFETLSRPLWRHCNVQPSPMTLWRENASITTLLALVGFSLQRSSNVEFFMFFLLLSWVIFLTNSRCSSDLRCHDARVMSLS